MPKYNEIGRGSRWMHGKFKCCGYPRNKSTRGDLGCVVCHKRPFKR